MADETEHARNIKKLQEIFESTSTEAENAYNYYNKDLEAAIQGLSSQQELRYGPENRNSDGTPKLAAASSDEASGSSTNNPIDLTNTTAAASGGGGGEDDLQKALQLSLLDMSRSVGTGGGGVARGGSGSGDPISQEDQDLSRALEASLADTQGDMKRLGMSYSSYEPLNPHERKRVDINPVGLKNIGNTCWFSSVIQSLFYIPQFRDCILNYTVPQMENQPPCVKFVEELQKLFALLLNSNQKYINPKPALDVIHSVFNNASGAQQDVSEFTHKLLEWMEDAFLRSLGDEKPNPIVDLFTGQCVTEGLLNEQKFVNKSQFGAFPVQVEGHAHLHDSLEAATVNTEMQQETWFTHLPPVLVIELSRFKYNQNTGQAEKIHDQLVFDLDLHLDRYLHINCDETRKRRTEVDKLRKQIATLSSTIRSYTNYQEKPLSIHQVLHLVVKFLHSRASLNEDSDGSLVPVPKSGTEHEMMIMEFNLHQWIAEMEADLTELNKRLNIAMSSLSTVYSDPLMNSTPYRLHAVLVHQGEASGGHYWAYVRKCYGSEQQEVVSEVSEPVSAMVESREGDNGGNVIDDGGHVIDGEECVVLEINDDETDEEKMETDEEGGKTLSLVDMISDDVLLDDAIDHPPLPPPPPLTTTATTTTNTTSDGLPSSSKDWLKCNDISVTEVDWAEVRRESFGRSDYVSTGNTSAYCLVYINDKTAQELVKAKASSVDTLNDKLIKYVIESNQLFIKTLEDYDIKQAQKKEELNNKEKKDEGSTENIKPAKNVRFKSSNPDITEFANRMIDSNPSEAKRARPDVSINKSTIKSEQDFDSIPTVEVDPSLTTLLRQKLQTKLQSYSAHQTGPARVSNIFNYATDCGFTEYVRKAILLETVSVEAREESNTPLFYVAMKEFLNTIRLHDTEKELKLVKDMYVLLCGVYYHCSQAVNYIQKNDWCSSLPHVFKCYSMNAEIQNMHYSHSALNSSILAKFRAKVVLKSSHQGTDYFNSGQITHCTQIANTLIVPAIKELTVTLSPYDEEVIEKVRGDWCNCLGNTGTLTEDDSDKLADLLGKILDDAENSKSANLKLPDTPTEFNNSSLIAQFTHSYKYLLTDILPNH